MQIIAHRGASGTAPENTFAAFHRAWELGADGIETDIHLSADGVPICIHDAELKRLTGVRARVDSLTLAELKQLDVGRWKGEHFAGERIPTLEEVLKTVPFGKTLLIEVKDVPPRKLSPSLAPVLKRHSELLATRRVLFMSFFPDLLWEMQSSFPDLTQLLLAEKLSRLPAKIPQRLPCDALPVHGIGFSHKLEIPAATTDALLAAGSILAVWTENDPDRKSTWIDREFDYLITDHPERFVIP